MTSPDHPIRLEFSVEVPGTPEQVWDAIATAQGLSAWFARTDVEERSGGALVTHMGPGVEIPATIVRWDPPYHFAYEEPEWAEMMGHPGADVTPLASEFLVEARSGGTCVVRVVSSAFGTGADWENEAVSDMGQGWMPFFEQLRLYLTHFAGRRATVFSADAKSPGSAAAALDAMRLALGARIGGEVLDLDGRTAVVERPGPATLVRLIEPVAGFLRFQAFGGDGDVTAQVLGYLFAADGDDVATVAEQEGKWWSDWLTTLDLAAGGRP